MSVLACLLVVLSSGQYRVEGYNTDPDPPDVSGWKLFTRNNISIRISDKVKYNLGFDLTYQNPHNSNEFVRQIRVLLPFVVVKNTTILDKNFADMAVAYVTDGAEKDLLKDYLTRSDPVLSIRWRMATDFKRDTYMLDGKNEVWFWNSSGTRVYVRDTILRIDMMSDTFEEFDGKLMVTGLKYSLNKKNYRAHEVPHAFIVVAIKQPKGGK